MPAISRVTPLWMLALVAVAASLGAAPSDAPVRAPSGAAVIALASDRHYFHGLLVENGAFDDVTPAAYCLDGQLWRGATYRVGRLNIFGPAAIDRAWIGGMVLVEGERRSNLFERLTHAGPCVQDDSPSRQFRSDWLADEGGYLNTREQLVAASYLEVRAVRALELLSVDNPHAEPGPRKIGGGRHRRHLPLDGAPIVVTVDNPFAQELTLQVFAHYEGGPGKSMPHYVDTPLTLAPGTRHTLRVAPALEMPWGPRSDKAIWSFHAVGLRGRSQNLEILESPFFDRGER